MLGQQICESSDGEEDDRADGYVDHVDFLELESEVHEVDESQTGIIIAVKSLMRQPISADLIRFQKDWKRSVPVRTNEPCQ